MNTCYIFGALPCGDIELSLHETDLVIAADGGLKWVNDIGITPDYIVGDFDSLPYTPTGSNVIKHPVMKDETDTILAIDIGFSKGYNEFIIYGCLGGRLDHTIGSIQTAHYVAEKGGKATFRGNNTTLTVIKNSSMRFPVERTGTISVFSLIDKSLGVSETGLLYSLYNATLTNAYPLGISNEFKGEEAEISVKDGVLCIITD